MCIITWDRLFYVKTKGMALGNYRYMISLGMPPTEADIEKNYANRNLKTNC